MTNRATRRILTGLAMAAVLTAGCGPAGPALSTDSSGQSLFEAGQRALAEEDWGDAHDAFDTLLKNYPASPYLAEARLGLGKANIEMGRADTLVIGIDAFEGFLTYHPSHERTDYAQYMIGIGYMEQIRSADRDQSNTELAVEAFDRFLASYPDSELRDEVLAQRRIALDRLAQHELEVAEWQVRRGYPEAAIDRARVALETYPETTFRCQLTWVLGEAYRAAGEGRQASEAYQEIVEHHPECRYSDNAVERLRENGG